jgi:hypothetical protein
MIYLPLEMQKIALVSALFIKDLAKILQIQDYAGAAVWRADIQPGLVLIVVYVEYETVLAAHITTVKIPKIVAPHAYVFTRVMVAPVTVRHRLQYEPAAVAYGAVDICTALTCVAFTPDVPFSVFHDVLLL